MNHYSCNPPVQPGAARFTPVQCKIRGTETGLESLIEHEGQTVYCTVYCTAVLDVLAVVVGQGHGPERQVEDQKYPDVHNLNEFEG